MITEHQDILKNGVPQGMERFEKMLVKAVDREKAKYVCVLTDLTVYFIQCG